MNYSLNKRTMSVGPKKGEEVFVASAVCQKHRISFGSVLKPSCKPTLLSTQFHKPI